MDDVLEYRMNRVATVDGGDRKTYDLEVEQDSFWRKNAARAFPEAIEDNEVELGRIKDLEKEIKNKTAAGGGVEEPAAATAAAGLVEAEGGGTQDLLATVDSLPKLLERKKKLESHTNILSATMRAIAARDLPVFFEAETSDMLKSDKAKLEGLLGASKGTLNDKLRLLAVLTLRSSPDDAPLLAELEAALAAGYEGSGYPEEAAELAAGLEGIKHMRQMQTFQAASAPRQV